MISTYSAAPYDVCSADKPQNQAHADDILRFAPYSSDAHCYTASGFEAANISEFIIACFVPDEASNVILLSKAGICIPGDGMETLYLFS